MNSGLPVSENSFFVFTKQRKNHLYVNIEDQMTKLIRDYTGEGEYLALYYPE